MELAFAIALLALFTGIQYAITTKIHKDEGVLRPWHIRGPFTMFVFAANVLIFLVWLQWKTFILLWTGFFALVSVSLLLVHLDAKNKQKAMHEDTGRVFEGELA